MRKFLPKALALAGFAVAVASAPPLWAFCEAPKTVNGVWKSNDGGTYHVHAYGNTFWWVGTSGDEGRTWMNIFKGTRKGDIIEGEWTDVRGKVRGRGTLKLRIFSTSTIERIGATGSGFAGVRWGRGGCQDSIAIPG